MSVKKLLVMAILIMVCSIPLTARAQSGFPRMGPGGPMAGPPPGGPPNIGPMGPPGPPTLPPPFMMALRSTKLTAQQEEKLRQILDSDRATSIVTMKQLHSIHEQIATKLLSTGPVTDADLAPLSKQAAQIDEQMQQQGINTALHIRAILTPEQLSKMSDFHTQMTSINAQIRKLLHGSAAGGGEPTP